MSADFLLQENRRLAILLLVVFILGAGWIWVSRVPPAATTSGKPPQSPRQGFIAPDFTLDLLGGGQVSLSELRGSVLMINLWASWCPPCRAEMPAIQNAYEDYHDRGFEVLAINTTYQDQEEAAQAFVNEFGLTFPVLLDRTGSVANRYLLRALPTTFFVDRDGVIQDVVIGGPMSEALIRSKIEAALEAMP